MYKNIVILLTVVMLSACMKNEGPVEAGHISAVIEDEQTKTSVTDEGVSTWAAGDKVWLETSSGSVLGTLSSGAGTSKAQFSYGSFIGELTGKAVYPYNSGHKIIGNELNVVMPASYDLGTSLSNTNALMYAVKAGNSYRFNHLAGVIRFKFKNVPAGTDRFTLTLDKKVNGTFVVDLDSDQPMVEAGTVSGQADKSVTLNFAPLQTVSDISLYVPLPVGTYKSIAVDLWAGEQSVLSYANTVTNTVGHRSLKLMPTITLSGTIGGEIVGDNPALTNKVNSNVRATQVILTAIQQNEQATKTVKLIEDGIDVGYTLTFEKYGTVNVYYRTSGNTPQVGIRKDTDGEYYWSAGEGWLTGADGNKIPATVTTDGNYVTPQFRCADNIWSVSLDNGTNWVETESAEDGLALFEEISNNAYCVYLIMTDGEKLNLRTSPNLWDGTTLNGYVSNRGAFPTHRDVTRSSGLIPVKPNTYYYLSGRNSDLKTIRCLAEDKTTPYTVLAAETEIASELYYLMNVKGTSQVLNGQFKTPAEAAYVQFGINLSAEEWSEEIMLEEVGSEYLPNFLPTEFISLDERMQDTEPEKPALKILLIGSSHGMNTITQFPWICYKSGFNVTVGNVYRGSLSLRQIMDSINENTDIGGWFKVFSGGKWSTRSSTNFNEVVSFTDWDYISIQRNASNDQTWTEEQSAAMKVIIDRIKELAPNATIVFNSGFADTDKTLEAQETKSRLIIESAKQMQAEYQLEIMPVVTAIQNARKTSLTKLGNFQGDASHKPNQLCYDNQHLDYGIGCYVAGATLFEFFFRQYGFSVLDTDGYGTYDEAKTFISTIIDTGGETGAGNAYTEPTPETMEIAKQCAIAAVDNMEVFSEELAQKYPIE